MSKKSISEKYERKISEGEVDEYLKDFEHNMDAGDLDNLDKDKDDVSIFENTVSDYNAELIRKSLLEERRSTLSPVKSISFIYSESNTVVENIIQTIINEFIIKSLEEIAVIEQSNSEFIPKLIDDLIQQTNIDASELSTEEIVTKISSELEKRGSENIGELKDISVTVDEEITETTSEELIKTVIDDIIIKIVKYVGQETSDDMTVAEEKTSDIKAEVISSDKLNDKLKEIYAPVVVDSIKTLDALAEFESLTMDGQPHTHSGLVEKAVEPSLSTDLEVLDPENPLMLRFQIALKALLEKHKRLNIDELLELKGETREQYKKEEALSNEIYNMELKISQQQQRLKKGIKKIEEIISNWENTGTLITNLKVTVKEKFQQLEIATKKDSELQIELESLSALIQQFVEWEEKQGSEITATKLMSERQKAEKKKLFAEKQKLDLLILAIRKDVLKQTRTFSDMENHIQSKTNELHTIEQTVADANADIEELLRNNRKIMQLWGKNVIAISQRDKTLHEIKVSAEDHKLKYNSLEAEIEGVKKESNQLIKDNEQLTAKMKYIERAHDMLKRRLKEEFEKKRAIEDSLSQVTKMKYSTENDLRKSRLEAEDLTKKACTVTAEIAKVRIENTELEEKILNKLLEQSIETKTAQRLNNTATKYRNMIREQEVAIANRENKIAKLMVETEKERMLFQCGDLQLKEINDEIHEKEMTIKKLHTELEHTIFTGQQTQSQVDKNQRKLEQLREAKGESELSPEEIKIRELEKNISDLDEESANLQQFWLRQENHIVAISQQRTEQLQQISILRKQLIILDKKNMTIENDIQAQEKERKNYLSLKESLQKKLSKLNEELYKKKGYKDTLDNNNTNIQNQYLYDLKDAEDASIALQNEINDLDREKTEMYNSITELQKELLAWEKKLQMAVETRQLIETLNADGGEMANMKNEIHRMEIRYSQLRKAQEKLTHDMELCITRRDGICDMIIAREHRHSKGGLYYTKQQFARKCDELKNGIKATANEIKNLNNDCSLKTELKKAIEDEMETKNQQLRGLKTATEQMDLQLAEGHLHRQKNLELLIRLQRKYRHYSDIKISQYKLLFRNENSLEGESQKQKKTNLDLISITECLINDFPSLKLPFTGVLNNLRITNTT